MTTLIRNWTSGNGNISINNVPSQATLDAQAKEVLLAFKNNYKSAGWTVEGSSDAATAGMDASDRWGTDVSKVIWAAGGVAHSWIVLKSPTDWPAAGKNIWLMIGCSTGASNQHLINTNWASAAFTGGTTTTTDPVAPTNNRAYSNKQFLRTGPANSKYHMMRTNTGDVLNFVSVDGAGIVQHASGALQSGNAESGDNYPFLGIMAWLDTSNGGFSTTNMYSSSHMVMFWHSDGSVLSGSVAGVVTLAIASSQTLTYFTSTGSNISGKYPQVPAILASVSTTKVAYRGNLVDVYLAPSGTGVAQGTVEPASGNSTTAIFGEFWVPNNNTVPSF